MALLHGILVTEPLTGARAILEKSTAIIGLVATAGAVAGKIRALVDDPERPGRAHYLLVLNLARADGLTGMFGGVVAGKARTGARKGLQSALGVMKHRAERGA